jgi:hypothetical protein
MTFRGRTNPHSSDPENRTFSGDLFRTFSGTKTFSGTDSLTPIASELGGTRSGSCEKIRYSADRKNIGPSSGAILIISMKVRVDARIDDADAVQRFSLPILGLR